MANADTPYWFQDYQQRTENQLQRLLPAENRTPQRLHQAMRYACLNGGKRIRAVLVYATGHALDVALDALDPLAAALECIHAYSLVHDDLPAMDNDDLRRGKPTCHIAFDEATAILTGDALQTLAFDILCHSGNLNPERRLQQIQRLAAASGSIGMAGGQAIDLAATGKSMNLEELEHMHGMKTGALIRASVQLAVLQAYGADDPVFQHLDTYAQDIGLAFQIQDDILDVEGDTATLGKTQGADQALGKSTYPALLGLETAKNRAQQLHLDALSHLQAVQNQVNANTSQLAWISDYIIQRKS